MNIELSLRRRAARAQILAGIFFSLSLAVLVGTLIYSPSWSANGFRAITSAPVDERIARPVAGTKELSRKEGDGSNSIGQAPIITVLILGFSLAVSSSWLLAKAALLKLDSASRMTTLADALCITGSNLDELEKAVAILGSAKSEASPASGVEGKDLETLVSIVSKLRGG